MCVYIHRHTKYICISTSAVSTHVLARWCVGARAHTHTHTHNSARTQCKKCSTFAICAAACAGDRLFLDTLDTPVLFLDTLDTLLPRSRAASRAPARASERASGRAIDNGEPAPEAACPPDRADPLSLPVHINTHTHTHTQTHTHTNTHTHAQKPQRSQQGNTTAAVLCSSR